jgi:hypothetical protein
MAIKRGKTRRSIKTIKSRKRMTPRRGGGMKAIELQVLLDNYKENKNIKQLFDALKLFRESNNTTRDLIGGSTQNPKYQEFIIGVLKIIIENYKTKETIEKGRKDLKELIDSLEEGDIHKELVNK